MPEVEGLGSEEGMFGVKNNETASDVKAVEKEPKKDLAAKVENMFNSASTLAEKSFEINKGNTENT